MDEKYIVLKTEDFEEYRRLEAQNTGVNVKPGWLTQKRIMDAVVIRKQDLFAAAALHTYASSISIAISIIEQRDPEGWHLVNRLRDIADYFHEAAVEAEETGHKVPD